MERYEARIEASYLTRCSPESAYEWLEQHRSNAAPRVSDNNTSVVEYLLLRRREPLIDLGLARFGRTARAIRAVYLRGDAGVRCAALANPMACAWSRIRWMTADDISVLVSKASRAEWEALVSNPHLDDDILVNLIKRQRELNLPKTALRSCQEPAHGEAV